MTEDVADGATSFQLGYGDLAWQSIPDHSDRDVLSPMLSNARSSVDHRWSTS
ncbi:MAG TPA: hypothetical protein VNE58_16715 [Casimicrobiaceae bacterium]|nr:hypothetical protein [Casimicrobiaceae bacterium]